MFYKILSQGKNYKVYSGNKPFNIARNIIYDQVKFLSFDENTQTCAVKIVNPSKHTLYLFNQGRLGIDICRSNTGKGQRRRMWAANCEWRERNKKGDVQWKYHPRWSRILQTKTVTDLNYIEIFLPAERIRPNEKTVAAGNYFTTLKAVLVTRNFGGALDSERSYKTNSNFLRIKTKNGGQNIYIKNKGEGLSNNQLINVDYSFDNNLNAANIQITFNGNFVKKKFEEGYLYYTFATSNFGIKGTRGEVYRANWGRGVYEGNKRWSNLYKCTYDGDEDTGTLYQDISCAKQITSSSFKIDMSANIRSSHNVRRLIHYISEKGYYSGNFTSPVWIIIYISNTNNNNNNVKKNNIQTLCKIETPFSRTWSVEKD